MIIGMDFGTTNTGAATYDGEAIRLLPLDPASNIPTICRSSIYITRGKEYYLGSAALNLYFDQNVGRPTRYRKVRVGEIIQVFAELPTFYRDVYVYEDEFSPGRLFLSIKTALRNPEYYGTVFLNNWYSASDLAATFLMGMKLRIDQTLGSPVNEVVLGRPVHFSNDANEDRIAENRLLMAAFKAGFEKVYLEYEPVAAALSYERELKDKEIVLVYDFGGGTLDFTVMEIGAPKERRVLATGGIPIAGDVFDQRLFRVTVPKHLGENDYFESGGSLYPIPAHIFDLLSTPQEVLSLNTPQNLEMLRSIHQGAVHKEKTQALLKLVSSNYALLMFDLVERAKRRLSEELKTRLEFTAEGLSIHESITRAKFEQAIQQEYEAIRIELEKTLLKSGIQPKDIHRVIRTGGSSQIPVFIRLLNDLFGAEKVRQIDVFSSVTSGLAIRGCEISSGFGVDGLREYTPDSFQNSEEIAPGSSGDQEVAQIDLSLVLQRFRVARDFQEGEARLPGAILIAWNERRIKVYPAGELTTKPDSVQSVDGFSFAAGESFEDYRKVLFVRIDRSLLLVTNQFRLISVPASSFYIAQQVSEQGIRDLLHLEPDEAVMAITPLDEARADKRFLCLITEYAQARNFDGRLLAEHIAKQPYFQLERRYDSLPAFLLPAGEDEMVAVGTNLGRIACLPAKVMQIQVNEILRVRKNEKITATASWNGVDPLLAIGANGTLVLAHPDSAMLTSSPKGMALNRNFHIIALIPAGQARENPVLAITAGASLHPQARLLHLIGPDHFDLALGLPLHHAMKLGQGERIIACQPFVL